MDDLLANPFLPRERNVEVPLEVLRPFACRDQDDELRQFVANRGLEAQVVAEGAVGVHELRASDEHRKRPKDGLFASGYELLGRLLLRPVVFLWCNWRHPI